MDISLQILLFVAVLILLAKTLGGLGARTGLPVVLGELLAGVILGPTLLNVWRFSWFSSPAAVAGRLPLSLAAVVKVFAQLGVVVLMFLAGLETDVEMMRKAVGPAFWAACGGVILPFVGGASVARAVGLGWREAVFVGAILTATSVSITAQTLMTMNQLRSKVGSTILGAAVIDDVLGLTVLSVVIAAEWRAAAPGPSGWTGVGATVVRMVLFLLFAFLLGPRLVRLVFKLARHLYGPHIAVTVSLALAFIFAFLAEYLGGMAAITGSYLAGLFIASTPAHGQVIQDVRSLTNSFFGPLFFASVGLEVNAREVAGRWGLFVLLLAVAVLGKVFGCGLGASLKGLRGRESLLLGVGMIPRGEVELITASIGWSAGLISSPVYSVVVVLVLATTLIAPISLHVFFPREPFIAPADSPVAAELPERPVDP